RIGLAATTKLDDLPAIVETAIELAAFGAEAKFELPGTIVPTPVEVFATATEQMVTLGQEMIDQVRSYDADILCEAGVRRTLETVLLLNSRGGAGSYRKSSYTLVIGGQLIRGQDFLSIWEYEASCDTAIDHRRLAETAIRKFDLAKTIVPVATKRMPVIFTPRGVASVLLPRFSVALSGKSVLQGASALSDKLGQPL